ncbi:MAG: hypothetical protein IJB08_05660 [Alistipes sp.]|nr:hypothetical protein [Alistipes sp.]
MRSRGKIARRWLVVAVALLSQVCLCSCGAVRNANDKSDEQGQADSVKPFVPTHPPVVVGKTWRKTLK